MTVVNDWRVPGTWIGGYNGRGSQRLPQIGGWGGQQKPQSYGNVMQQFQQNRPSFMNYDQSRGTPMAGGPNVFGYGNAMQRQMPAAAGNSTPWDDPRRMQRDPRLQRGAHPMQQQQRQQPQQGRGWEGHFPNGVPSAAGSIQRFGDIFRNRANQGNVTQPTAPATMGAKPRGQWGRMY